MHPVKWFRWMGPRAILGALTLLPVVLTLGCGPHGADPAEGFAELNGLFVADDGVYVVPDRGWRREGDHGGSFRKTASLLVYIQNDRPDGLRVNYRSESSNGRRHFQASWDDQPLWSTPRIAGIDPLVAEIEAVSLSPGLHRLRLDRVKELEEDQQDPDPGPNVFSGVDVERIDDTMATGQPISISPYLARFLKFGVTSQTSTQLSGCLFLGPQRHSFELVGNEESVATFVLQNQSREAARFSFMIDGDQVQSVDVEPRGSSPMEVVVPSGRREVTLEVRGSAVGAFLWGAPHLRRGDAQHRPTVVLITLDTTRRDAVSPYSGRPDLTPVLDRLARSATAYSNAYAVAPWTLPTHASIFTGMYPSHHRAGVADDVLSRDWVTLAELYRRSGYRTAGFAGGSMASSRFGLAQGFDTFMDPRDAQETADKITDAAIGIVEAAAQDPLFLFLNYFDPHAPYEAPTDYQNRFGVSDLARSLVTTPHWGAYADGEPGSWNAIVEGHAPSSDLGLAFLRAKYEAEVAYMDSEIGRFFGALKKLGRFDEALIVVVADHGEFLGERGLFSHSYRLDRELTAIPLIVKWPHQTEARVVDGLVSHVDLFPTIASAAGLECPDSDGVGFSETSVRGLAGRSQVFMEEHESRFHQLPGRMRISDHLFGLQQMETRQVVFPGFIECARREGDEWVLHDCDATWEETLEGLPVGMRSSLSLRSDSSASDLDEEDAERLRALGYLN